MTLINALMPQMQPQIRGNKKRLENQRPAINNTPAVGKKSLKINFKGAADHKLVWNGLRKMIETYPIIEYKSHFNHPDFKMHKIEQFYYHLRTKLRESGYCLRDIGPREIKENYTKMPEGYNSLYGRKRESKLEVMLYNIKRDEDIGTAELHNIDYMYKNFSRPVKNEMIFTDYNGHVSGVHICDKDYPLCDYPIPMVETGGNRVTLISGKPAIGIDGHIPDKKANFSLTRYRAPVKEVKQHITKYRYEELTELPQKMGEIDRFLTLKFPGTGVAFRNFYEDGTMMTEEETQLAFKIRQGCVSDSLRRHESYQKLVEDRSAKQKLPSWVTYI